MRLYQSIALFIVFTLPSLSLYAQSDPIGSGRAISFDGVDDYIDFGDIYSDLELPFTISAWVYVDPTSNLFGPIFTNRNCDPIYTGFRLIVDGTRISLEYGDGFGGNDPAYRNGKEATVDDMKGSWNHITAVVRSVSSMDLYRNGINVGGGSTGGSSTKTMDSSKPGFASSAYFISNSRIYRFKGVIDDIRLWNRALSETEIRQTMCVNLNGDESGLIGYWDFNETSGSVVADKSANHFNGTFVNGPVRVFSGAPIGDVSTYYYAPDLTGKVVSLQDGDYKIDVKNMSNTGGGVQVYEVKNSPSQMTGLDLTNVNKPYFGVFMAEQNSLSDFDFDYSFQGGTTCQSYSRADNSKALWSESDNPAADQGERIEVIGSGSNVTFDLGPDRSLCDQNSYEIETQITDPLITFQWNNGQTTSAITVTQSGKYVVNVSGPCGIEKDSVTINFFETPPPVSLGIDRILCDQSSYQISTGITDPQLTIHWNNNQNTPSITVNQSGQYIVEVSSPCGVVKDTIVISFLSTPKPVALGKDTESCELSSTTLHAVKDANSYAILWQDGSTDSTYTVTEFGTYWVSVKNACGEASDTIVFSKSIHPLGFIPNVITPNHDGKNDCFMVEQQLVGTVSLRVVNRWGQEVFFSPAYDNKWDGGNLSTGTYFILLEGQCDERNKGMLHIVH